MTLLYLANLANKKLVWRAVLSGNNTYSITSNSTMVAGNWYHVVLTHDASYTRLYINGSLDKQDTLGGTIVNLGKALKIGWDDYAADRVFNGLIDEVRIWNGALGSTAIQQSSELGGLQSEDPDVVVQLKHKVLTSGEFVCFTFAFYLGRQTAEESKPVDIFLMSASDEQTIEGVGLRLVTPARTNGDLDDASWVSDTHWDADVTNGAAEVKGKKSKTSTSIHLYAELNEVVPEIWTGG